MLEGKNIFIVTGGGVGDLIMFTPALRRLKELEPDCNITILTKQSTVEVINRVPWIDHVIGVRRGTFLSRYRVLPEFRRQDIAIFTEWSPHLLPWSVLFHIPQRIGYARKGKILSNCLTQNLTHSVFKTTAYAAETNARLFSEALGILIDGDMTYCAVSLPNEREIYNAETKLASAGISSGTPYLLLTPYSSRYNRDWNRENITSFIALVEKYWHMPVVVAGITKEKNDRLQDVRHNLLDKTDFMELVVLVQKAAYHLSTDSGPMHVAAAVGTPIVSLFNKDLPSRWAPKHRSYPLYLGDSSCADLFEDKEYILPYPDDRLDIRNITAQMAFDALNVLACHE